MSGTSILDSLVPTSPPGILTPPPAAAATSAAPDSIPTMTIRPTKPGAAAKSSDTSILDSLPPAQPTPAMLMQQQSAAPQSTAGGMAKNIAAGATDVGANIVNTAADPFGNLIGKPLATGLVFAHDALAPYLGYKRFDDDTRNMLLGDNVPQPGARMNNAIADTIGAPRPDDVPANSPGERIARKMVGMAGSAAALSPAGVALPAALGGVGAVVGDQAAQAAPDWAKPAAELAGNVAGAAATGGGLAAGKIIARPVVDAAENLGIGPKENVGGVNATGAQIQAAGQKVGNALGDEGKNIIARATSTEQEARDLEAKIADPTTAPADLTSAQQRLSDIQEQRINLVPGSNPTTAQVAQTPGAVDLDQALRVADRAPFNQRSAEQNNARVAALQGVQPTGEPLSVGRFFTQQLDAIDQAGQAATDTAQRGVQGATEGLGGHGSPAESGEDIRGPLVAGNKADKVKESDLWNAIDPDGTLALPLPGVKQTAAGLLKELNPALGDATSAREMQIMHAAATLPDVIAFRDAQRLRSNLGAVERELRASPGNDQSLRRLGMVKSALDGDIANASEQAAQADHGIAKRLSALRRGSNDGSGVVGGSQLLGDSNPGNRGQVSGGHNGPGEAAGVSQRPGSENESHGEPGLGAGDSSVAAAPANAGLEPNFDSGAAKRYADARQATLNRKQTFGQGAVGRALQPGQQGAEFRADVAEVPKLFLSGNAVEPARVQKYIQAVGGAPKAVEAMRGALVNDLREKGIIQPDGTLKPDAFATWRQRRARTIEQFPGLDDGLENAAAAQKTLDDATAKHIADVKNFQKSAAGDFIKEDPIVAVRKAFSSGNPTQTFTDLARAVKGNADAEAGLKRAVVEYIEQKLSTTQPSGKDVDFLNSSSFRKFIDTNKGPLRALFGGQGMQTFEMIAADLQRTAQRANASEGSPTASNESAKIRHGIGLAAHSGGLTFLTLIGEHLGEAAGHSVIGAVALPALGSVVHALRQAGIKTINDLTQQAMLHPELAHVLVQKVAQQKALSALAQKRIGAAIQSAMLADMTGAGTHPKQRHSNGAP